MEEAISESIEATKDDAPVPVDQIGAVLEAEIADAERKAASINELQPPQSVAQTAAVLEAEITCADTTTSKVGELAASIKDEEPMLEAIEDVEPSLTTSLQTDDKKDAAIKKLALAQPPPAPAAASHAQAQEVVRSPR